MDKTTQPPSDFWYICRTCAEGRGWRWPKGHCATMHSGTCAYCGKGAVLSCLNDWLKDPKQKELKGEEWD